MKYIFIANRFCLDLVNTIVAGNGHETDLLTHPADVSDWLGAQELYLGEAINEADLKRLKDLRALIRHWVLHKHQNTKSTAKSITILNTYLSQRQAAKKLVAEENEFRLEAVDEKLSAAGLLIKVAEDFATLLAAGQLEQVKQCSAESCILVFLDTSKSKRRRWCSMSSCGNRAKASAFYHSNKAHH